MFKGSLLRPSGFAGQARFKGSGFKGSGLLAAGRLKLVAHS